MAKYTKTGELNKSYKTGLSRTRTYRCWNAMRQRCNNPKRPEYKNYGGRGIHVCNSWNESFENFLADMGVCPSNKHTIDRLDNEKGYSPENCKWVTYIENLNNKRSSVKYTINGKTMTVTQWAREKGCSRGKLFKRLYRGWSFEKAYNTP